MTGKKKKGYESPEYKLDVLQRDRLLEDILSSTLRHLLLPYPPLTMEDWKRALQKALYIKKEEILKKLNIRK